MIALVVFWVSFTAVGYTYLLYPLMLRRLASRKKPNATLHEDAGRLPTVSVLMAVHNEEDVLYEKLQSIMANALPGKKLEVLIGSDASNDGTNVLLEELAGDREMVQCYYFERRMGKSAIINELAGKASGEIIIITDANVMMGDDLVFRLARHFRNGEIGLVDSNMRHRGLKSDGISIPENVYVSREVMMKYHEGIIWGTMMGPAGGCYALRKELFREVPRSFLADDFFVNMNVLCSGYKSIVDIEAVVYEDVSNSLAEEFRRKIRISAGNFQNLAHFPGCLFSRVPGLSLCFLSHKVLRWLGPFLMTAAFGCTLFLAASQPLYRYFAVIQIFLLIIPIIDHLLGKIKIHILILRFITHFLSMNFALMVGFVNYLKGVKSNVWQPTRRNQ